MKYEKIIEGKFISRPNRFVAEVEVFGEKTKVHVKNTGRLGELLVPGAVVYLEDFQHDMRNRKMRFSLIGVVKETPRGRMLVNIDSQAPNKVVGEALRNGSLRLPDMANVVEVKQEFTCGNSRLDFYVRDCEGREGFIEVKGVTLEENGAASFPDAPTERGIKHINELTHLAGAGNEAYIIFVLQMRPMKVFRPNDERHKAFGEALRKGKKEGVKIMAYQCSVTEDTLILDKEIPVDL
ncbi:MAG: DNA/RNA nuclease SfsA [Firmicutes bacterium]|nr:DNA/RNA nuclease SfsA [Bacillota bacterium]